MSSHWPASPGAITGAQLLQRAQAGLQQGAYAQAADACRHLLAVQPAHADANHLLGLACKGLGDYPQAESHLTASVQLAPRRADFHANLGNLLQLMSRYPEAVLAYRRALECQSGFRPAWLGLIRTHGAAGDHRAARDEAQSMLRVMPRDADAWVELALATSELGAVDAAEAAYRQALAIQPGHAIARHNLGALLSRLERADEALVEIEHTLVSGVRGHAVLLNLAITLAQLGRFEHAERSFEAALQAAPGHLDTHVRLAKLRFMRGQPDFARSLHQLATLHRAHPQVQLAYASLLRDAGELPRAREVFTEAIGACDQDPVLAMGLALTEMEAGCFEQALPWVRAAVAARATYLHVSTALQSVLLSLGRADEAWPLIQQARAIAPFHQEHIACEAVAARLLGLPRYSQLYDFEQFLRSMTLEPPSGYASMAAFNEEFVAVLAERQQLALHPLDQSLRFGAQTSRSLLTDPHPLIQRFLACLQAPIQTYRDALSADAEHPLLSRNHAGAALSGCWAVRLQRRGHHLNHVHPSGWISAACYVHAPAEVDDLQRRSGWIKFGEPRYPVPGITVERMIQPRAGTLVMFPSYLWHGTLPLTGDEPRVTVGFDVVPA